MQLLDGARYTSTALEVALLGLLAITRLSQVYPAFFRFLFTTVALSVALAFLSEDSPLYAIAWAVAQPVLWAWQCATVYEVFRKICEHYPKLGNFAGQLFCACFGVAGLLSLALCLIEAPDMHLWPWWMRTTVLFSRCISLTCALLISLQALFFVLFPVPLCKNLRIHRRLLLAYLVSTALVSFYALMWKRSVSVFGNTCLLTVECFCYGVWLATFRSAGENVPVAPSVDPERSAQLDREFDLSIQETQEIKAELKELWFG